MKDNPSFEEEIVLFKLDCAAVTLLGYRNGWKDLGAQ